MDEMNSASDNISGRNGGGGNSLKNSPRAMCTSLEGGLDDVDLLAIGQGSPIGDIIQRVFGNSDINAIIVENCRFRCRFA